MEEDYITRKTFVRVFFHTSSSSITPSLEPFFSSAQMFEFARGSSLPVYWGSPGSAPEDMSPASTSPENVGFLNALEFRERPDELVAHVKVILVLCLVALLICLSRCAENSR